MKLLTGRALFTQIVIICALFTVPVAVAMFFVMRGFDKDIEFARLEKMGNEYERPLERLLEFIPQQESQSGRVDEALKSLAEVNSRVGVALQFTPEGLRKRKREHANVATLKQEWEALKSSAATLSGKQLETQRAHLMADVRTMIAHAGDTSNLILDPDLDSYYLMDTTLVALPQTQDRLAVIGSLGSAILARKKITSAERTEFAVMAALLRESDLDRNNADLQTSLSEDQNFYGVSASLQSHIPPAQAEYSAATEGLLTLMKEMVESARLPVSAEEFERTAASARQSSFKLWNTGAHELDLLLDKRMAHFKTGRLEAAGGTVFALLFSSLVAFVAVRRMNAILRKASSELTEGSAQLQAASAQVANSSQSVAQGACQQAASLKDLSKAVELNATMAQENSESSRSAAATTEEAERSVERSNAELAEMLRSMAAMKESSEKVAGVIRTIEEIAFQTNILALNAAIEAARAGDAGLTFAVVADEVRSLAERSARAARETTALIEQSVSNSDQGSEKLNQIAATISALTDSVSQVRTLMGRVSETSLRQTQGTQEIVSAISSIESATQSAAASTEETAAASEELSGQASGLRGAVTMLTELLDGR